jgi:hypothetical protein
MGDFTVRRVIVWIVVSALVACNIYLCAVLLPLAWATAYYEGVWFESLGDNISRGRWSSHALLSTYVDHMFRVCLAVGLLSVTLVTISFDQRRHVMISVVSLIIIALVVAVHFQLVD